MIDTTWERAACVRILSGRTQTQIAKELELQPAQLSEYEAGMSGPWGDRIVARLADALGVGLPVLTNAAAFREWLGDRPLPAMSQGTVLGIPSNPSVMRVNGAFFRAVSASSVDELERRVNQALEDVQPDMHLLSVSPVTVAASDDDGGRLYIVSIVYAAPEAVSD